MCINKLSEKIEYQFKNEALLRQALTHSSSSSVNYERLEFLGDAVLELFTSKWLFEKEPNMSEGSLTKLRAEMVCEESLYSFALHMGIGSYIILGKGEALNGGREKPSILADIVEAILGAIFLDGGYDEAAKFVLKQNIYAYEMIKIGRIKSDYKSALQELLQKDGRNPELVYKEAGKEGSDHDPDFKTELYIKGELISEGKGRSKKNAEQNAAKAALNILNSKEQLHV